MIERPLFCCPVLWSGTAAARTKLAGHHPGGEIQDAYYTQDYKYFHYSQIENCGCVLYTGAHYIRDFTVIKILLCDHKTQLK